MSNWSRSQLYEREYVDSGMYRKWNIPVSEKYWLDFMRLDRVDAPALEVGCGNQGIWKFNQNVIGLDPIDFSSLGSNFVLGKAESMGFEDNHFRDVYCVNALDHCENPGKAVEEMVRVSSNRIIIWCYTFKSALRPVTSLSYSPHPFAFTDEELVSLVPSNVKIMLISEIDMVEAFSKYTHSLASNLKLRVARAMGVHALLIHLRKTP